MIALELLEVGFRSGEAPWIWAVRIGIIIRFLPDIINYILRWRRQDDIQRMVAAASTHKRLGTRCAFGLLAMIKQPKYCWVDEFDPCHYTSGSRTDIHD